MLYHNLILCYIISFIYNFIEYYFILSFIYFFQLLFYIFFFDDVKQDPLSYLFLYRFHFFLCKFNVYFVQKYFF